ncbi:hypothetical protein [Flavobacterium sp. RS13.1]|jgi:hypothetical protein|uniref:hypothetical protein n=1 Tax=Flavobacterium sp. RS13.1 TaxID=3400345 RepID=UPI003AB08B0F
MKKILTTSLLVLVTALFFSCSNDDEKTPEPTIIGKWEYYKDGSMNSAGEEYWVDYNKICTTQNNFIEFTASNFSETNYSFGCQKYNNSGTYTNKDKEIRFFYNGNAEATFYYVILSVSETELKVKKIYPGAVYVSKPTATTTPLLLFKRINETNK